MSTTTETATETAAQRARRVIEAPSKARDRRKQLAESVALPEVPPVRPSSTGPPLTRWLDTNAQAARYGVCPRSIRNMHRDGRLPPYRFPIGAHRGMNTEQELDENDRRATRERSPVKEPA